MQVRPRNTKTRSPPHLRLTCKYHNHLPTHLILIKGSSFPSRWRVLYLYYLTAFPLPYLRCLALPSIWTFFRNEVELPISIEGPIGRSTRDSTFYSKSLALDK